MVRLGHDGRSKEGSGFVGYGDTGQRGSAPHRNANTQSTHVVGHIQVGR